MKKNILILNGATRKHGNTLKLVDAFADGASSAGNNVEEFFLYEMEIHDCKGCNYCGKDRNPENPCVQKDDMHKIYEAFIKSDVVVFASPIYFWTITGILKTVTDRLYAELRCLGYSKFPRQSVLIMTADSTDFSQAVNWYRTFERNLGWKNLGEILGKGKEKLAKKIGESI